MNLAGKDTPAAMLAAQPMKDDHSGSDDDSTEAPGAGTGEDE